MIKKINGSNIFKVSVITSGISNIYCSNDVVLAMKQEDKVQQINAVIQEEKKEGIKEVIANIKRNVIEKDGIQEIKNINAEKKENIKNNLKEIQVNNVIVNEDINNEIKNEIVLIDKSAIIIENNGGENDKSKNIEVDFSVKTGIGYVLKNGLTNLNIDIEDGESYTSILKKINAALGNKNISTGFKMYKNDKNDSSLISAEDKNINDITKIFIEFDSTATDFVEKQDDNKIYITIKFDVTNSDKFELNNIVKNSNQEGVNKGAQYDQLLNVIKRLLNTQNLKEGYKIYKKDKNTEFSSGALENHATYIYVFADDDTTFVKKKKQNPQPKQQDETNTTITSSQKKDYEKLNNSGTICFCGKNKDNSKKEGNGRDV